jgi:hypothetical protein
MTRSQIRKLAITAAVTAAGLGATEVIAACGASGQSAGATAAASAPANTQTTAQYSYSYYRSMMSHYFGGSMMGGSYGWIMGPAGYRWMTGAHGVPGWMRGGHFPAFMMGSGMMGTGTGTDPGKFMGRLWGQRSRGRGSPPPRPYRRETRSRQVRASTQQHAPLPSPWAAFTWQPWPVPRAARMRPSASPAWSTPRSPSRPGLRSASKSSTPIQTPPTGWSSPAARPGPRGCR